MKPNYLQNPKKYFQTYLPILLLLLFSWSTSFATECDEVQLTTTNTAIQISNIEAPKAIIKIFDSNWKEQGVCNDNCGTEVGFTALNPGAYHIQIQLFDENWEGLCETTIDIFLESCFCPAVYMPVCGVDGKTYGNSCEAACAGVEVAAEGECGTVTTCDLLTRITFANNLCEQGLTEIAVYELDGKSYLLFIADNVLLADGQTRVVDCDTGDDVCFIGGLLGETCDNFLDKAEKLETIVKEDCSPCLCPALYAPVCGVDGRTYDNECEANCAGVAILSEGACEPVCICTEEYAPVCGVDGKTYSNRCVADCAGVDILAEGECTPVTTCELLNLIDLNPDLCSQCLSEIAIYSYNGKNYLVSIGDHIICADVPNTVIDCETGEAFCNDGGGELMSTCGDFFSVAEKIEVVLKEDCSPCLCPAIYAPVCGVDGRTYDNECEANCAGVAVLSEGACEPVCICTEEYAPVCGVDGKTYSNRCVADCAGVDILAEGECTPVTTCELLNLIDLNPDLCSQCLSEIAIYSYNGKNYLVSIGDNIICADVPNTVIDCETGEAFCNDGGGELMSTCGDFFSVAEKIEVVLKEDCSPCLCPALYAPVCGVDGRTYDNECEANCAGVAILSEGACEPVCICTEEYAPVCGVDGKTYSNRCVADCAGVDILAEGECTPVTTCELLNLIDLNPDLCSQCLSEIAIYSYNGKNYLVSIGDHIICADVPNTVIDCETGEAFCNDGGGELMSTCGDFFSVAEKIEVVLKEDCSPCLCPALYAPVCGVDGRTYDNECEANCAGVAVLSEGACEPACICTEEYAPVCGIDGKTYSNRCVADCAGVDILAEGECNNDEECDVLNLIDFSDDLCGACITEIAVYSYEGKNYLVSLGDFVNCPDAVNTVTSCAIDGNLFCEEGGTNTGTPCGDFFEKAVKVRTVLKDDCEDDCQGLPTPGAPCPEIYQPVCACNGQTYDNECMASNLGLKSWTEGACETTTTIDCGINITHDNKIVVMTGDPTASYFFKIHDINNGYAEIFDCSQNCGSEQTATLPPGAYLVKVYDTEWARICEQTITLADESIPNNGTFQCTDATITYKNGTVKLVGDEDQSYHMKVVDANYKDAFSCMWACGSTITATNLPSGKYSVRVFDEAYDLLCEESIFMTANSSTIRENNEVQLAAYPNPAQTEFFLRINKSETKGKGTLQVINAFGQMMTTQTLGNQYDETIRLDLSNYQNGLYFYQVKMPNQKLTSGKFLVSRLY